MINLAPARRAVRQMLDDFDTNAFDRDLIWRFVGAALTAVSEEEASGRTIPDLDYVIMRDGHPVAVRSTRGRARGERRRIADETGHPLRSYSIHPIPRKEQD